MPAGLVLVPEVAGMSPFQPHRLAAALAAGKRSAAGQAAAAVSGKTPEGGGTCLVTRSESATGGTPGSPAPFFVDWLSLVQEHPEGGLPLVDAGAVVATKEDGDVDWISQRSRKHEGSHETHLNVKCDGHRVTLSGNVGRFGRPDNVFGFDFFRCLQIANEVLAHYGLPPFTPGHPMLRARREGHTNVVWTGARVQRIDLTANYETGSAANAHALLQYLGTQKKNRQRGKNNYEGETVDWGNGKRQYWKAYNKAHELEFRKCPDARLVEHCKAVGLVRFEGTIRTKALTELGCAYLGDYFKGWAMTQLIRLFNESSEIMSRAEKVTDDLETLPRELRATARDYMAGMDMRDTLSRRTYFRHRAALLPYGIDIAMKNLSAFKPRVQVIQLKPAEKPHWYQLVA